MPTNARRALDARYLPSRAGTAGESCADNEERRNTNQKDGGYGSKLKRKSKRGEAPASCMPLGSEFVKRRRRLIVPVAPEHILQLLHFGVRLARAVPQIIVFHAAILIT